MNRRGLPYTARATALAAVEIAMPLGAQRFTQPGTEPTTRCTVCHGRI
jgi:hypothetical protein